MSFDVHQRVTDHILATIENLTDDEPVMPWRRMGVTGLPSNVDTGNDYQGINILTLWLTAIDKGYPHNLWGTYKQWQKAGAQVRKGEKSTIVVFYKEYIKENGDGEDEHLRFARASWAFNSAQVDGHELPERKSWLLEPLERDAAIDAYIANTGADIVHGGDNASYSSRTDIIRMPEPEAFYNTSEANRQQHYYSVLLHELTHWTKHPTRLNRDLAKKWGDATYAMEELIAELGSAFQCAELGLEAVPTPDHARYVANWLNRWKELMKGDKKAVFHAAAKASEAVEFIKKLQ